MMSQWFSSMNNSLSELLGEFLKASIPAHCGFNIGETP
jgi:hypothetical protein